MLTVVRFAKVSAAEVGTLCVLQIKVVPVGFVPVLANDAKLKVVVGQVLVIVVAVMIGAVVPAKQATGQFASWAAPFWLVPIACPVDAIVGTPKVVAVLPTVFPKFLVTELVEVPV